MRRDAPRRRRDADRRLRRRARPHHERLFGTPPWWVDVVRDTGDARRRSAVAAAAATRNTRSSSKSEIADLANVGGRPAGAITAAMFLKEFTGGLPWAHLDIAGTAWVDEPKPYSAEGRDRRRRPHAGGARVHGVAGVGGSDSLSCVASGSRGGVAACLGASRRRMNSRPRQRGRPGAPAAPARRPGRSSRSGRRPTPTSCRRRRRNLHDRA